MRGRREGGGGPGGSAEEVEVAGILGLRCHAAAVVVFDCCTGAVAGCRCLSTGYSPLNAKDSFAVACHEMQL